MVEEFLNLAFSNGLWATLFCILFIYQLRDSRAREGKYTATIEKLTVSLEGMGEIKTVTGEILGDCVEIKTDCKEIKEDNKEIKKDCAAIKKTVRGGGNEV